MAYVMLAGAMLYQLSYEATQGVGAGQFVGPVWDHIRGKRARPAPV